MLVARVYAQTSQMEMLSQYIIFPTYLWVGVIYEWCIAFSQQKIWEQPMEFVPFMFGWERGNFWIEITFLEKEFCTTHIFKARLLQVQKMYEE